jgi:hypothetical protein
MSDISIPMGDKNKLAMADQAKLRLSTTGITTGFRRFIGMNTKAGEV